MWFCVEVASALFAGRQEEPAILNCRLLLRMHRCSDVGSFVKKELHQPRPQGYGGRPTLFFKGKALGTRLELHASKEICDHAGSDLLSLVVSSRVF